MKMTKLMDELAEQAMAQRQGEGEASMTHIRVVDLEGARFQPKRQPEVPLAQCQGKIFGGGAMFPRSAKVRDIGMQNGDYARSMLQQHGIHVVSESLFGEGHRHLIFTIRSGEVLSRQVPPEPGWGSAGAKTA